MLRAFLTYIYTYTWPKGNKVSSNRTFSREKNEEMGSSIARLGSWHISVSCAGAQGLDRPGYQGWFSSDPI